MSERLDIAVRALQRPLCDHCLGRLFAKLSTGMTNDQRGAIIRAIVSDSPRDPGSAGCDVCKGLFDEIPKFADIAVRSSDGFEFSTFLVGTKVDSELLEKEEQLWADIGAKETETLKSELNREIGKQVEAKLQTPVEFTNPDMVYLVDTRFDRVEPSVTPLFVYGRYRKFSREIPQTRWPCRDCRGKGCPRCDGKGVMYEKSVQDLTGPIVMRHAQGEEDFFHGMGREDIDARMLGNGRPFVVEVRKPRRRTLDLAKVQDDINSSSGGLVEVEGMRPSSRSEMRAIKESTHPKTYRVRVRFQHDIDDRKVNDIGRVLAENPISQQTPNRVSHRRADLERIRTVRSFKVETVEGREAVFVVEADSGTYIKELMHGDEGRTKPNVADVVGVPCEVLSLDVIWIGDQGAEGHG